MNHWKLVLLLLTAGLFVVTGCSDDDTNTPADPPELDYAGSDVCASCHSATHEMWEASGHPYKLTPITDGSPAAQFPSHSAYANDAVDPPNGTPWADYSYTIGGYAWKIRWIQTDGYIHTPAAGQNQYNFESGQMSNYHAGETKVYNCGNCHTTGWEDSDDGIAENNHGGMEGFEGTFVFGGVHCEKCHGMGNQHAFEPQTYALTTDSSSEFCGKCHTRGGDNGVAAAPEVIEASYTEGIGSFIKHHEQYDEWYNSPHNVSYGPGCNTCHNPHASTVYDDITPGEGIRSTATCTSCHVSGDHADIASTTHGHGATCKDCHMPDASKSAVYTNKYNGDVATHLWSINTSINGKVDMFSPEGTSVVIDGDTGHGAITLDFACYGCHKDEDGVGGDDSIKTMQELVDRAANIHTYVEKNLAVR